jgi:hypothetical protein
MAMTELQAANAVSDSLFATSIDPDVLADDLRHGREQRIAEDALRWRAWLEPNIDRPLDLVDVPWLFPIGGRSSANPCAPVIGRRELRALVDSDPWLAHAMGAAFDGILAVLGLVEQDGSLHWIDAPRAWAMAARHDHRVYRMLRSVHNAGLRSRSAMLMNFFESELAGDPTRADALSWYRHQVAS